MKNHLFSVVLLLFMAPAAIAQEPTLVIENGRVIAGDGPVLEKASVVVVGDSIVSVTREPVNASQARRIDASGKTVLPGLIDAHVHLTIPPDGRDSTALVQHINGDVPRILRDFLKHGVTTVRSTGDYWPWIRDVRDRVAAGELPGPRIVTAGPVFTAEGAHPVASICAGLWSDFDRSQPDPFCRSHVAREVTGPEQARQAVRQMADEGVDFIKFVSDSVIAPVQIGEEVVEAIVDQAHSEGLRVSGHVAEPDFMERAADAGVDGFVHAPLDTIPDDRASRLARDLVQHGTPATTTLSLVLLSIDEPTKPVLTGKSPWREYAASWARDMAILANSGVPLVVGTDWCPCFFGTMGNKEPPIQAGAVTVTEMQMLRWGGMSRPAIIQAATANAARALEMEDRVGTLEAGKLADLIVVDGNPLEELSALEDVEVVVQDGKIVRDADREGSPSRP